MQNCLCHHVGDEKCGHGSPPEVLTREDKRAGLTRADKDPNRVRELPETD